MAALSQEVKAFIVMALACYDSPKEIADRVKEEFNTIVSRQQIAGHDPTNATSKTLGKKWVELFNETRERFQNEISDIPIANKAYRLRALNRMASKAETMRNYNLTAQLIEQAAKECGDAYTNKQKLEHTSPDGSMTPRTIDASKLSTGALEELLNASTINET
ncbi:DUF2280 domain-containing protein [Vibrio metschnikovii]|uniref:DUF2280 domain-containing protein n=1 Tax=Vibrio metschnikovii TaxID=28172 RepID=UPI001302D3F7|nr:DUF2280 domain-containing protein [Vibrio metschnikovii]